MNKIQAEKLRTEIENHLTGQFRVTVQEIRKYIPQTEEWIYTGEYHVPIFAPVHCLVVIETEENWRVFLLLCQTIAAGASLMIQAEEPEPVKPLLPGYYDDEKEEWVTTPLTTEQRKKKMDEVYSAKELSHMTTEQILEIARKFGL